MMAIMIWINNLTSFVNPLAQFAFNTLLGFSIYLLIHALMRSPEICQLIELVKGSWQKINN